MLAPPSSVLAVSRTSPLRGRRRGSVAVLVLTFEQGILEQELLKLLVQFKRIDSCNSRIDCCSCGVSARCCESLSWRKVSWRRAAG